MWIGLLLWFSSAAALPVTSRFTAVGKDRTALELKTVIFPASALGSVMIVPFVPSAIDTDSMFQQVLLMTLFIVWAVVCLGCTSICLHLRPTTTNSPHPRSFFSRHRI